MSSLALYPVIRALVHKGGLLYLAEAPLVVVGGIAYPATHHFVVKEKGGNFRFIVEGIGGQSQAYLSVRSQPDFDIDWGDGTTGSYGPADWNGYLHTYAEDGEYVVTITAHRMGTIAPVEAWLEILAPFPAFEESDVAVFSAYFAQAPKLRKVSGGLFRHNPWFSSFQGVFYETSLEEVPPNLFEGCDRVLDYQRTFQYSALSKVPHRFFSPSPLATNFEMCFQAASSFPKYPANLLEIEGNPWEGLSPQNFRFLCGDQIQLKYCPPLWEWYPQADGFGCFEGCTAASNYDEVPYPWKLMDRGGSAQIRFSGSQFSFPVPTTGAEFFTFEIPLIKTGAIEISPVEWYFTLYTPDGFEEHSSLPGLRVEPSGAFTATLWVTPEANDLFDQAPAISNAIRLSVRAEPLSGIFQGQVLTANLSLRRQV